MRILIATCHRGIVGGVETYLRQLIPALLKNGHHVAMLYDYTGPVPAVTVDPPEARLEVFFCDQLRKDPSLWSRLHDWHPEVVYTQGVASLDCDQVLLEKYPVVFYAHVYFGTCTTGRKCHAFPVMQPCQRSFGPMCLLLHYPRRCGGLNPLVAWKMYQREHERRTRLESYRAVLVASRHMYHEFEKHGVPQDKLHLVQLPFEQPASRSLSTSTGAPGRLLFLGRLTDVKGVDLLIDAVPRAEKKLGRKLALTIAGDGAEMARLQKQAGSHHVSIEFTGWVDSEKRMELLRRSDLLVVPSTWPEPFGLVGVEAGSMGLPAVAFAVGGIPDWLIPGQTGELAPADPPTAQGLADAIVRALEDENRYRNICQGAFELSKRYTLERHRTELETVLGRQVDSRNSARAELLSVHHDR